MYCAVAAAHDLWVALLAEGVDRNWLCGEHQPVQGWSPSSRRAWIEIPWQSPPRAISPVALLAEGVDRNFHGVDVQRKTQRSPSSRRAWIEIFLHLYYAPKTYVALLAEGVDRNSFGEDGDVAHHVALLAEGVDRNYYPVFANLGEQGRPPRGGRG